MEDNMFNDYEYVEDIDNDDRLENLIATSLLLEDRLKQGDIELSVKLVYELLEKDIERD